MEGKKRCDLGLIQSLYPTERFLSYNKFQEQILQRCAMAIALDVYEYTFYCKWLDMEMAKANVFQSWIHQPCSSVEEAYEQLKTDEKVLDTMALLHSHCAHEASEIYNSLVNMGLEKKKLMVIQMWEWCRQLFARSPILSQMEEECGKRWTIVFLRFMHQNRSVHELERHTRELYARIEGAKKLLQLRKENWLKQNGLQIGDLFQ